MLKKENIKHSDHPAFPHLQDDVRVQQGLPPDNSDPALKRQRVIRSSAHPQSETRYDPELIQQLVNPDEALQSIKDNSDRELFLLVYGDALQDVREIRCILQAKAAQTNLTHLEYLLERFDQLEAKLLGEYEPEPDWEAPLNLGSHIRGFRYVAKTRELFVVFSNYTQYVYSDVPPEVHQDFQTAEVAGAFLNKRLKGVYTCKKVER